MGDLDAVSPVDGRYSEVASPLAGYFSEKALMEYRLRVEGEYFIFLSEHSGIDKIREFSEQEKHAVRSLYSITLEDAETVKVIEAKTNHDLKAIEYFMKEKLKDSLLKDFLEWIHFGLTSEDVNNIAYGLMISDALASVILPAIEEVHNRLNDFAFVCSEIPMLARTHGQPASPTTLGKEFKVFAERLKRQIEQLKSHLILVKLNGATGNYNAHYAAFPNVDWLEFTKHFIQRFNENRRVKLKPNFITTQIEPHDSLAELFDNMRRLNTILIGFCQDIWHYIGDEWLVQKPVEGEVGSSTMPHKVNPIDFENAEGNLGIANVMLEFFSRKLPISRLQRDLSDSTVLRNTGVAFVHSIIAYKSCLKGLGKIAVDEARMREALEKHPEVIAEAVQTVLRREGVEMPYEKLKELTRGKHVTMQDLHAFIDCLQVSDTVKEELKKLTPSNYTGIARMLARLE